MSRAVVVVLGLALALAACSDDFLTNDPFDPDSLDNERPVAAISVAHAESLAATSYVEARFAWSGSDRDGFVVGFWVSIDLDDPDDPVTWRYTTDDDTVATFPTREDGTVVPILGVVAVDDRGALSDTVRVAFPLVNSPPVIEYQEEYTPPTQSLGAADFDLFAFDVDGDDTLLPYIEYRYQGSDPGVQFEADDPDADPAVGWVQAPRPRRGFTLRLRDIPAGDTGAGFAQTVYVRVSDDAGAASVLSHTWAVPEIRGTVLVVDDDDAAVENSRDAFFVDAVEQHLGDQYTRVAPSALRGERELLADLLAPFDAIIWYVKRQGRGDNVEATHEALEDFLDSDRDPDTPGVQPGRLYLDMQYVGAPAQTGGLNDGFRRDYLGLAAVPQEGALDSPAFLIGQIGPELDILSQDPGLADLAYDGADGIYFDLWPVGLQGSAPLYRFESARWSTRPQCRVGCEPAVAARFPDVGPATAVTMSFQIELADVRGNAIAMLHSIWQDQLGIAPVAGRTVGEDR